MFIMLPWHVEGLGEHMYTRTCVCVCVCVCIRVLKYYTSVEKIQASIMEEHTKLARI